MYHHQRCVITHLNFIHRQYIHHNYCYFLYIYHLVLGFIPPQRYHTHPHPPKLDFLFLVAFKPCQRHLRYHQLTIRRVVLMIRINRFFNSSKMLLAMQKKFKEEFLMKFFRVMLELSICKGMASMDRLTMKHSRAPSQLSRMMILNQMLIV